jgi:hypothetical protein
VRKSAFTRGWQKHQKERQKSLELPQPDPVVSRCDYPGCGAYALYGFGPPGFRQSVMFWTCREHRLPV